MLGHTFSVEKKKFLRSLYVCMYVYEIVNAACWSRYPCLLQPLPLPPCLSPAAEREHERVKDPLMQHQRSSMYFKKTTIIVWVEFDVEITV